MSGPSRGTCSPPTTQISVKNDQTDQSAIRRIMRCKALESDMVSVKRRECCRQGRVIQGRAQQEEWPQAQAQALIRTGTLTLS